MMLARCPPALLAKRFEKLCSTPSNINEHLPFLRDLAAQSNIVVELGTGNGRSTTALLMGQPPFLDTYDVVRSSKVDWLERNRGNTEFSFHQEDSRKVVIGDPGPDLLFIDTTHTYEHLMAELVQRAPWAKRWIALHDTVSYPQIMPAIRDFLAASPDWHVQEHRAFNNGLMLLRRI